MLSLVLACLAHLAFALAQNSSAGLSFGPINFASYDNYVYRDNVTSAQVVISAGANATSPSRFITAFPNGNTGALVYFIPQASGNGSSTPLQTTLQPGSLRSYSGASNQTGLQGNITVSSDLSFGVTLIGGVRTLRDYVESGGKVFNSIFNYTLGTYNQSSVTLVRHWINGTTVQYLSFDVVGNGQFNVTPNANITIPPNITLTRPDASQNATLRFTSIFNFTQTTPPTPYVPLEGLGPSQLFLTSPPANSTANLGNVLQAIQGPGSSIASQTSFLGYSSEFLAGGWRFLTYFGRDTLLYLRLTLPIVSSTSAEAVLGAVLDRINSTTGYVGHEDTLADYASFVNIQNNRSDLGNTPSVSYVMLDTDFLLLPILSDYFLSTPQGLNRSQAFLSRNATRTNATYAQQLISNVNNVLNVSKPFAENPTKANLVPIRDANVGDWRDSNAGLGGGKYPFDVECALIPAALRAIASLSAASILPSNYTNVSSTYAAIWETQACPLFAVSIDATTATSRLNNYVQQANLSAALLYGAGSLNATGGSNSSSGNAGFGAAGQCIGGEAGGANSTYYALSLLHDGTPVQILHSDLGFALLYGNNVSQGIMQAVVEALQPYPRGLLTNVGMVVANAAYDSNTTNIQTFNNLAYHGAVSWSWQQGLMASGLSKQLGLCGRSNATQLSSTVLAGNSTRPTWCGNTTLLDALTQAQTRLWDSIQGSAPALYTEVLSPVFSTSNGTFTIGDLGALSPEGTEGDAIQLWSYGFLAQVDPRSGKAVAAGFP